MTAKKVKKGDKVKVEYVGRLKNGEIFNKTEKGKPLEFTVGSNKVIRGFDRAVEGMELNQEKKVTIKAKDGYGEVDQQLIREFPLNALPRNFQPEKGALLGLRTQSGEIVPAKVVDMREDKIILDLNHPLAGRDLQFKIKVVEITPQ